MVKVEKATDLFVDVVAWTVLWLSAFAIILDLYSSKRPCLAILHLHEALVGVSLHVSSTHRVILVGAHAAAAIEQKLEILQAFRNRGYVDVFAANKELELGLARKNWLCSYPQFSLCISHSLL